jgi:hypothetical protein
MRFAAISMMIFFVTFAAWVPDAAAADEIYRWVDENGVVHFGDRSEAQDNAEIVEIQDNGRNNSQSTPDPVTADNSQQPDPQPSYAQQVRDERAQKRAETAASKQQREDACNEVRDIVTKLEPSNRVMVTAEDGTVSRMDGEVRVQKIAEAKAFLDKNCNN